ncbi:hypothetical protein PVAG01_08109 [Phlyctema vagabunda]|uniref:Uncharacterized protein n=1 Tax=Phlyctema vagabunda TaxID=108571 RepID=A0ABR4P8H2_9HELO
MGVTDFFTWRTQNATSNLPATEDDDLAADVDEPPDLSYPQQAAGFHKAAVRPQNDRKESLLTKALHTGSEEEAFVKTNLLRRRSLLSNASIASTADLTSDGGLTSPARTNTPSPPLPANTYTNFTRFALGPKPSHPTPPPMVNSEKDARAQHVETATPEVEAPKKRCITFACGARRPSEQRIAPPVEEKEPTPAAVVEEAPKKRCITFACGPRRPSELQVTTKPVEEEKVEPVKEEAPKRRCIQFACPGPKPSEAAKKEVQAPKPIESPRRTAAARSPSLTRKLRYQSNSRAHRDSTGTIRRASQSPVAVRTSKPKFIIANEADLQSDATRFSEFASEELQEDDWIRRDAAEEVLRMKKLTINDTLQKENAIRQLGNEAEEEALEDEEDEEEDGYDSDDETRDDDEDEDDDVTFNGSDYSDEDVSDGNETDNEAGFADSDDESDGEYQFWTPGSAGPLIHNGEASTYRPSAHRTASTSSIDSLDHMYPLKQANDPRRGRTSRRIKIRPGTPDLPDSTDFVCGTLDEDRPLEDAYISCMEARKFNHRVIPQDIDPSFPTSDPEEEEDEHDIIEPANDSEEPIWLHGEFEDSDTGRQGRRATTHRSPALSPTRKLRSPPPKRMHSPPPAKRRLHSPPPRKLFGQSPRRMRSPPPARTIRSPATSPMTHTSSNAIAFERLGSRVGVTHTKSLPRTPNAFCRQYRAARLVAANGNDPDDGNDAHVRGAIDIVKGLEQKRQRRKEKFYQKQCNRARKGQQPERKPQPGKGAERMKELGLLMAGKQGHDQNPYILSA